MKVRSCSDRIRQCVSVLFVQLVFTAMLVTSTTIALSETPSCKLIFFFFFNIKHSGSCKMQEG